MTRIFRHSRTLSQIFEITEDEVYLYQLQLTASHILAGYFDN